MSSRKSLSNGRRVRVSVGTFLLAIGAILNAGSAAAVSPSPASTELTLAGVINPSLIGNWWQLYQPAWWCVKGSGAACTSAELADAQTYRQLLVLPTGFTTAEYWTFRSEFTRMVEGMSGVSSELYSAHYKDKILYVGHWVAGGDLGAADAAFGGKVFSHPIRGQALTLRQDDVITAVSNFRANVLSTSNPFGVIVLFDSLADGVTANAAPPSFLGKSYGIAKCNRDDLNGTYVAAHELAHASLNFLDEYVEAGFDEMSISTLDYLTPLAVLDGSWGGWVDAIADIFGVYDINVSEILAHNGNDNMATSRYPSTVSTSGYSANPYEYEGGMFFGRGTWHDRGNNIMNSNRVKRAADDGFAYDHSSSQDQVVVQVFEHPWQAGRPNDRLRNAGPVSDWWGEFGSSTRVMMFDADKNHHFHPTLSYVVQVGWYDRQWKTCWQWDVIPYPCYDDVWTTVQKTVYPQKRTLDLKTSSLYGLAGTVQDVLCFLGVEEVSTGGGTFNLCQLTVDEMSDAFLPTFTWPVPYQEASVPATQWLTSYWWRFKTTNGTATSGYTSWSRFYRSL
ncbi:MAG: hypothetical protein HYV63_21890 [Candidatus Schekmanbacteria bacterium]|nr:hypothetical protein [Candidatus Schekmanbacteria bacterium]